MSETGSAVHEWQDDVSGFILDPGNFVTDTPFMPGDTLIVSSGQPSAGSLDPADGLVVFLTDGNYEFQAGQTDAPTLITDDVGFSGPSVVSIDGPGVLTWDQLDNSENDGDFAIGGSGSAGNLSVTAVGNHATTTPTFTNAGLFTLDDASAYAFHALSASATFDNAASGSLVVSGGSLFSIETNINGVFGNPTLENDGLVVVDGSASLMRLQANLSGNGTVLIEGPSGGPAGQTAVSIGGSATNNFIIASGELRVSNDGEGSYRPTFGGTVTFTDGDGLLRIDGGVDTTALTIEGFQAGDQIDVTGYTSAAAGFPGNAVTAVASYDEATGMLTIESNLGLVYASLHLVGTYNSADFQLTPFYDASEPAPEYVMVTTTAAPCFAAGTLIETDRGGVRVEALREGDIVVLAGGGSMPVIWIGRRRVACLGHPDPKSVLPVRVRRGAMGGGLPVRDLVVSPDHAVLVDGALVPAGLLVDGEQIVQETCEVVSYFHVELASHAVILAEGLPVESYLDTGNRGKFANTPLLSPASELAVSNKPACADLVLDGKRLEMIRAMIAEAKQPRLAA